MEEKEIEALLRAAGVETDRSENNVCPHCKEIISYGHGWIKHREVLSLALATAMGLGNNAAIIIDESVLTDYQFSNRDGPNYSDLASAIYNVIYK